METIRAKEMLGALIDVNQPSEAVGMSGIKPSVMNSIKSWKQKLSKFILPSSIIGSGVIAGLYFSNVFQTPRSLSPSVHSAPFSLHLPSFQPHYLRFLAPACVCVIPGALFISRISKKNTFPPTEADEAYIERLIAKATIPAADHTILNKTGLENTIRTASELARTMQSKGQWQSSKSFKSGGYDFLVTTKKKGREGFKVRIHCGILAKGACGQVDKYVSLNSNREIALKTLFKEYSKDTMERIGRNALYSSLQTEYSIGQTLGSIEGVIKPPKAIYSSKGNIEALESEYIAGMSLEKALPDLLASPVKERCDIARQVIQITQNLHKQNVYHNDLHPGNIMLKGEPGSYQVVFIDFGLAQDHPALWTLFKKNDVSFVKNIVLNLFRSLTDRGESTLEALLKRVNSIEEA